MVFHDDKWEVRGGAILFEALHLSYQQENNFCTIPPMYISAPGPDWSSRFINTYSCQKLQFFSFLKMFKNVLTTHFVVTFHNYLCDENYGWVKMVHSCFFFYFFLVFNSNTHSSLSRVQRCRNEKPVSYMLTKIGVTPLL